LKKKKKKKSLFWIESKNHFFFVTPESYKENISFMKSNMWCEIMKSVSHIKQKQHRYGSSNDSLCSVFKLLNQKKVFGAI